jgi:hypothetical protein
VGTPGIFEAAEPSSEPSAELAPDKSTGGMEELGEISSNTAGAPPSTSGGPCNLANCGVIVAIYQGKPQVEVQQDMGMDPGDAPGAFVGGGIDAGDVPMGAPGGAYVVETGAGLWNIEVQLSSGSKLLIHQNFQPLLQVGDQVLVEDKTIRLWN